MGVNATVVIAGSVGLLVSLTSCARSSSNDVRYVESGSPRYEIECAVGEPCDESVALLVGMSSPDDPMRCTAALIGPSTAVTAGHCVAWELSTGGSCAGTWLGFPATPSAPGVWVGCQRIESLTTQPDLLGPDYAVLELASEPGRRPLVLGTGAVTKGEVLTMFSVTADRFYDDLHRVHARRCVVDESASLAPFAKDAPSTIRVLSSCPIREGSSGAPVIDLHGRMRGLIHAGGPRYFAFGLMTLLPQPGQSEQAQRGHDPDRD